MADLKKDLDEYLLLQSDTKKQFKLNIPSLPKTNIKEWFNRSSQSNETEDESWFRETQKDYCPTMSRMQRITGFVLCIVMGIICFGLSSLYIPFLLLKARKFALLYTLGSLFFIFSFSFLWGPLTHLKYMFSRERLCLTLSYGSTLLATLYFAMFIQSTPLTVLAAVGQIITLLWTTVSSVPGGLTGMRFFSKIFSSSVSNTLPV